MKVEDHQLDFVFQQQTDAESFLLTATIFMAARYYFYCIIQQNEQHFKC